MSVSSRADAGGATRIAVIDCRDSYTYNLVAMFRALGETVDVICEDDANMFSGDGYDAVVLSPGPGSPGPGRGSWAVAERLGGRVPLLGVCLGHQTLSAVRGGRVTGGNEPAHGIVATIAHDGKGILEGIPNGFRAVRYNSLCVDPGCTGDGLRIDAIDDRGDVMAVSCEADCVYGVQFHPESFMSEYGDHLIRNFLEVARSWRSG